MKKVSIIEYCNAVSLKPDKELTDRERKERKKINKAIKRIIK